MKRIAAAAVVLIWAFAALAADLPQRVASIEGVTEYRLPNGLKILAIPDPGADTVTGIDLIAGLAGSGYDFGELLPAALSGTVVNDLDGDGVPETGERGLFIGCHAKPVSEERIGQLVDLLLQCLQGSAC